MRKLYVLATVLLAILAASATPLISAIAKCPPCSMCN